ncbi:uncharacterized protein LOC133889048 [Phragmites australis]|uniref:uncharacterized protein LOC133889048 n=1 Tax=Phragmites australis TaxID=29695 RepID=UPI002D7A3C82|nr:uncharacterized protein LOC133889048 [Phragmites australis]
MAATPALIHVESIRTAVPSRVAGAGLSLPITVSGPPLSAAELQRRFRAVLYYRGAGVREPEAAARERAAWVNESLSAALVDHPEMAGRLRRRGDGDDGRLWEVKLRDTGVRLVQASAETTMAAFLEATGKDRERKETALAWWTDVDVDEPDICAPFFMQLTRFQDGGYAIGASSSLLLADPLSLISFLKSWARKHAQLQAQNKLVANPVIQYTRYLQNPGAAKRLKSVPLDLGSAAAAAADATTTVLFWAANVSDHRGLAAACVGKACEKLGAKEPPRRFTVVGPLGRDGSGGLNVQACTADAQTPCHGHGHALRVANWREAGLEELALEGSKPVHVSYCVSPCADEGLVVVMPAGGTELLISATLPNYM